MAITDTDSGLRAEGRWLEEHRREMEQGESGWLAALARFDDAAGWALDGQTSVVDWLRWRTGMARSTGYEKAHLAQALKARPQVAAAFAQGRLSYSAARLICRLRNPDPETEAALITLAEHATIRDLEAAVHRYQQLEDQERPPADPDLHRSVRVRPDVEGWSRLEVVLPAIEAAELVAVLDAFMAVERREQQARASARAEDEDGCHGSRSDVEGAEAAASARAEDAGSDEDPEEAAVSACAEDGSLDEALPDDGEPAVSARAEDAEPGSDPAVLWRASRGLAFTEMMRCALAHVDGGRAAGDDRYLVHVVARDGQLTLLDGTPVDPATAGEILCDAAVVAHTVDEHGEPMSLGRRTRTWSTGQRRAVLVRDGGRCRFPGCDRRVRDIHHRQPWEDGGLTDVDNGMAVCRRHHTLLHHGGFGVRGETAGRLSFTRPDGTELGSTVPAQQRLIAA